MPERGYIYLAILSIFFASFVVSKFVSWMISKDRPLDKLKWSLFATNALLYFAITFGGLIAVRQHQDYDDTQLRLELLEEESLMKCPAPLFRHQAPPQHLPPLNPHPGNQLPKIFFQDRSKEVWL